MKKKIALVVNAVISLVLIGVILSYAGVDDFIKNLESIDLGYLLLAVVFLLFTDLLMIERIKIILYDMGEKLGYFKILWAHFIGMLLADFTPARTGYFATAGVLHYRHKIPSEKAMVSVFGPQIYDFALKVVAGSIAIIYLLMKFIEPEEGWIIILGSVIVAGITLLMILLLFSEKFLKVFSFSKSLPLVGSVYELFGRMQKNSHFIMKRTKELVLIVLIAWVTKAVSWYFVAKSVGITLDTEFPEIFFYFFLQPLVTMLEFLPTPTIAGLGLSEGGSVLVFSLFGIDAGTALVFGLLARFKTTVVHLPAVPESVRAFRFVKNRNNT